MRTRCPGCETVFRITAEQLRVRSGHVRCGTCHHVFNAFDSLVEEVAFVPTEPVPSASEPAAETQFAPEPLPVAESRPVRVPDPDPELTATDGPAAVPVAGEATPIPAYEPEPVDGPGAVPVGTPAESSAETTEQSTEAARLAGLMAAREMAETPGYNRWAAGTLAGNPIVGLESAAAPRATWPFVLVALLLALTLAGQLAYHYRTELVHRLPEVGAAFAALDIDIPLPRQVDLVSIEASDLQADNGRGMLVLQATLKNRAPYAQAWPALELALTDTHDTVVARRVLHAADYLPPGSNATSFAANGESAVRLWIEAKGLGAAGYRLYIFYP